MASSGIFAFSAAARNSSVRKITTGGSGVLVKSKSPRVGIHPGCFSRVLRSSSLATQSSQAGSPPSPVCSSRQKQRNLNHEEGCGSPHPAPAGLKIPLSSPVFSLSTLQLAPLQTRDAGTASWPAQRVTEPLEREAHCPQTAKRHG